MNRYQGAQLLQDRCSCTVRLSAKSGLRVLVAVACALTVGGAVTVTPNAAAVAENQQITFTANAPVLWQLDGVGAINTKVGTSTSYKAPAKIATQHALAGCPVLPADSIFNTRIENLPVLRQSSNWLQVIGDSGL